MLYQLSYFRFFLRKNRVSWLRLGNTSKLDISLGLHKNSAFSLRGNVEDLVGGGGLEPPNPEGADLQSAAIATMRTSQNAFQYFKAPLSR